MIDGHGFTRSRKRKFPNFVSDSFFLSYLFGKANASDLGLTVGACRKYSNTLRWSMSEHAVDSLYRLKSRDVSKPGRPNDVTGSIDAFGTCGVTSIDLDITPLLSELDGRAKQSLGIRNDPNSQQQTLYFEWRYLAILHQLHIN